MKYDFRLIIDIDGITLFSSVRKSLLVQTFRDLLKTLSAQIDSPSVDSVLMVVNAWSCFINAFLSQKNGKSFFAKIASMTFADDNLFTRAAEHKPIQEIDPMLTAFAKTDLTRLGRIASANVADIGCRIAKKLRTMDLLEAASLIEEECRYLRADEGNNASNYSEKNLSLFSSDSSCGNSLEQFAEQIHKTGAGEFGLYQTFHWESEAEEFLPVTNHDSISLNDLHGYEVQREIVIFNTLHFLKGKPANNLLLYGDRGTGKSATVKAVCNEYARCGLRLLEVKKKDLFDLPKIMERLSARALKFILFVDDLSFEETDSSFTAFKAFIEGGVESKPDNVIVYTTSNRRHLVKERIEDRPSGAAAASGDMRVFDTMQEQFSLADRFGVTVIFTSPNQDEYLKIAEFLGEQRGLFHPDCTTDDDKKHFRDNALRWEKWFNGRSPRTAVQFVDWLEGGDKFPWE